ncbi:MAG: serine--tRNA ligase [Anaerolineae bacterium]|nr:serine--tRNA ligase [Anaerolineae bacterium]NUQ03756.1 serine--tRNA ligase [Anaerolineae bacterium]
MLDIALLREKPEWVKEQLRKLNDAPAIERVDAILELDKRRRALLTEAETVQAARNKLNKSVGRLRGDKSLDDATRAARAARVAELVSAGQYDDAHTVLIGEVPAADAGALTAAAAFEQMMGALGAMGATVERINETIRQVEADLGDKMLWLPNLPHESVPVFDSEEQNIAWTPEGSFYEFDFQPKPHWDLGPALDIIDFDRGIKIGGSRAYVLKGMGARLQRALISFFLDTARANGFTEVYVPYMVREEMMFGAGQFPKFRENVYHDPEADLYMLPTAEVAVTNLYRDEILEEAQLPLYYAAHTPCFRREKTSAGRDVRGIKRVHQFEKVELYKFTAPEKSYEELESLTEAASSVLRLLRLPFRRLEIVTGDLGFSASKKYDLEVFSPGCGEWLEVSSCSNTEDFQARRANLKYRPDGEKKPRFVHTLNGSGLATPRVIIAILENYQQADGSVVVPEALRPYIGAELIPAP